MKLLVYWDFWSSLPYPSDRIVHVLTKCKLRQINGMALTSLIQGHFCLKFWLGALTKMTVYFCFFCQIPVWCKGELPHPCGDPTKFALSGMPYIERRLALLIEVCTLILMWFSWLINLQIFCCQLWQNLVFIPVKVLPFWVKIFSE